MIGSLNETTMMMIVMHPPQNCCLQLRWQRDSLYHITITIIVWQWSLISKNQSFVYAPKFKRLFPSRVLTKAQQLDNVQHKTSHTFASIAVDGICNRPQQGWLHGFNWLLWCDICRLTILTPLFIIIWWWPSLGFVTIDHSNNNWVASLGYCNLPTFVDCFDNIWHSKVF